MAISTKKFIDYDGLTTYDTLLKSWVEAKFVEMFKHAAKYGYANDVRTYESVNSFPLVVKVSESGVDRYFTTIWDDDYTGEVPSAHVEYVDRTTQTEYIWEEMVGGTYSGEYKMVNETASESDIQDIFDEE